MPNLAFKSACKTRIVASKLDSVMAAGTSLSAIWMVASATFMPFGLLQSTSIITTFLVCVRSAKNSVWPVKVNPAWFITPLWTGAVTIASNSPVTQPSIARVSVLSTYWLLAELSVPASTGAASGVCNTFFVSNGTWSCFARSCNILASPIMVILAANLCCESKTQISGPMPAGSPAVIAMRGSGCIKAKLQLKLVF